jgi:putative secretion ATPase (PEP-CTERM system associated)
MLNIHETVYKLDADPFRLSPDHRFAYGHRSYARSKAYLDYALLQGEGFVMITGAPGTGKTTLIREIMANIDIASVQVATLTSTQLRTRDLLQMVATAFNLRFADADKATLLTVLEQFLMQQCQSGRRAVLIVDEAQGLSVSALEELRLLANLQRDNQMLLQVFLLGQDKLRDLIGSPGMEQLRQRVVASSHLEPLSLDDTVNYVQYRLTQAGWQGDPEIGNDALQVIHKYSGGIPRRINLICTRLLLSGGMKDKHVFNSQDAQDVILELQQERLIDPDNAETQIDVAVDTISSEPSTRDITPEEESPVEDQSSQRAPSSDSTERAADVEPMQRPPSPKPPADSGAGKAAARDAAPKSKKKKAIEDQKQESSAPVVPEKEAPPEKEAAQEHDMVQPAVEVQVQIPPSSEKKSDEKIDLTHQDSPVKSRSISMAAARAAPVTRGRQPTDKLTTARPETTQPEKSVASSPGTDGRKPAVETAKRKGRSLKMQMIIFLLAVGPLAAVVGVKFQDYVITISAQVDREGMLRRVMPSINHIGDKNDELVANGISKETRPEEGR